MVTSSKSKRIVTLTMDTKQENGHSVQYCRIATLTIVTNYWSKCNTANSHFDNVTIRQGCKTCGSLAEGLRENGERMRNGERFTLHFLIFSLFPPSLSISYIKNCLILSQNVKHGTFVANVKKFMCAMRK